MPEVVELCTGNTIPRSGMIRCPFHDDHTPSCMIYAVKPYRKGWYCFGCHKGGSVIDWVMNWENVGFYEAIRIIDDVFYEHEGRESGV